MGPYHLTPTGGYRVSSFNTVSTNMCTILRNACFFDNDRVTFRCIWGRMQLEQQTDDGCGMEKRGRRKLMTLKCTDPKRVRHVWGCDATDPFHLKGRGDPSGSSCYNFHVLKHTMETKRATLIIFSVRQDEYLFLWKSVVFIKLF